MRKLILVAHTSLDGFVAGIKGELDGFDASEENLQFVCKLTEDADAALFGRVTYELLNGFWPTALDIPNASVGQVNYSNWYNNAFKIVVSRKMSDNNPANTIIIRDNILNKIRKIKEQEGKSILIFGSPGIFQLLQEDLIDSYWIFINPAIFGKGISLFAPLPNKIKLKLVASKEFKNGEIALHYERIN